MYEVAVAGYGRRLCRHDGPAQGLLEWPEWTWTVITPRPVGLARAKALADAQPGKATVQIWMTADKVYDNGQPPVIPDGWWPATATTARDPQHPERDLT